MKNIEIIELWSKINLRDEKNKGEEFEAKHGLYTHGFESLCPTRSDLIFHPRIPGQRAFPWDDPLFFPCLRFLLSTATVPSSQKSSRE